MSGPRTASVVDVPTPSPGPSDVAVRVAYVGLCGTDLEILHGTSPYLQDGRAEYPHRFGHEWVGTVVGLGSQVTSVRLGDTVTGSTMVFCGGCDECLGGYRNLCARLTEIGLYGRHGAAAELLVLPARAVASFGPVPPEPSHVLVEPLVTVLEALQHISVERGTEVLVIGAGTVGSLAVAALAHAGATVDVLEPRGVEHLRPESIRDHLRTHPERRYRWVVEASGAPGAFGTALGALRVGGTCLLVGVSPHPESVDPGRLALDGLRVVGVRHGVDHYERAVALYPALAGALATVIDRVVPLAEVDRAFDLLGGTRARPKVVLAVD